NRLRESRCESFVPASWLNADQQFLPRAVNVQNTVALALWHWDRIGVPVARSSLRRNFENWPADGFSAQKEKPSSSSGQVGDRKVVLEHVARIDVHEDHLTIRFKPGEGEESPDSAEGRSLSIPWQKPSSRKSRQILVPCGVAKNEVR